MGAGVQTTALLLKYWERYDHVYAIFADTGDEMPETYAIYIKIHQAILQRKTNTIPYSPIKIRADTMGRFYEKTQLSITHD